MNGKKNESRSIQRLRKVFLNFSLILSLLVTIVAFEWNFQGENFVMHAPTEEDDGIIFYPPITRIESPSPPKPIKEKPIHKFITDINISNENDLKKEEIENNTQVDTSSIDFYIEPIKIEPEIDNSTITYADFNATPPTGMNNFRNEVAKEVSKSLTERDKRFLSGKQLLIIEFIVEKDGSLSGIKTKKGVIKSVDKAAERKIKNSGTWSPAQHEGRVRRQKFYFPIKITLTK